MKKQVWLGGGPPFAVINQISEVAMWVLLKKKLFDVGSTLPLQKLKGHPRDTDMQRDKTKLLSVFFVLFDGKKRK